MSELEPLYEATVTPDQIDHLGHMNVRYYLEHALAATGILASRAGLTPSALAEMGTMLEPVDLFTRHYREQLAGVELVVRGGLLEVEADGLRFYHELVNAQNEERAATFVQRLKLRDRSDRSARPLPEMAADAAGRSCVDWPEHGKPRTLSLERGPGKLTLESAHERGLAMRAERVVGPEECDSAGFYLASNYQELVWGGESTGSGADGEEIEYWNQKTDSGTPLGWAILENRGMLNAHPRVGSRIQSFGAAVEVGDKTSVRHSWVFDVETGELVCTSSIVDIAFDIEARRAISIPSEQRERLEGELKPDLR